VAAVRQPDDVNPEMRSSSCQFYVVTGKYFTEYDLKEKAQGRSWQYTDEQKKQYMFEGGAPHLDGTYTVFGRLLDGWGTIDKIQRVDTDDNDRPLKNIIIKSMRRYTPKKK
jgi:peptidyl-prolyl cis-trans isomerase, cyclophilin-type